MEVPYPGRAIIQDNVTDLQIIIPVKKNWFIILFLGAWLCGWACGEVLVIANLIGLLGGATNFFIFFWLIGWTVGGCFTLRIFFWNVNGKEIITVGQGELSIDKKGVLFYKPKIYSLNDVRHIRVQDDGWGFIDRFSMYRKELSAFNMGGTIRFDYGLETVKFAYGLHEAEAKFIVQKMIDGKFITDKNY